MNDTVPVKSTAPLLLVTGVSGAGKSSSLKGLEDLGFEAVDNLPVSLIGRLVADGDFPHPIAIGIDIGIFMGGIVVVESVFGWPGIGQLAWQAIQRVDIPIIMGVTLVSACAIVIGNLLADLVTPLIDPRIKLR